MMRSLVLVPVFAALLAGCMGGPPIRSVLNDPEEMARRRASTQREIDRRLASLDAHRRAEAARAAEQAGWNTGTSNVQRPVYNPNQAHTECVLRSSRAQLRSGRCG